MKPRHGIRKGIYLLPSFCSTLSLFASFFAIGKTLEGALGPAIWAIFLAAVFDFLDGRIARYTHSTSDFGLQYDSLVDLVSFGVAPGLFIYIASLRDFGRVGWFASFLFVACGALRLARYNARAGDPDRKDYQGLPIPVAGLMLVGLVAFFMELMGEAARPRLSALLLTVLMALFMVSNIRFRGLRWIKLKNRHPFPTLAAIVGLIFLVSINPVVILYSMGCLYILLNLAERYLWKGKGFEAVAARLPRIRRGIKPLELVTKEGHDKRHPQNL